MDNKKGRSVVLNGSNMQRHLMFGSVQGQSTQSLPQLDILFYQIYSQSNFSSVVSVTFEMQIINHTANLKGISVTNLANTISLSLLYTEQQRHERSLFFRRSKNDQIRPTCIDNIIMPIHNYPTEQIPTAIHIMLMTGSAGQKT